MRMSFWKTVASLILFSSASLPASADTDAGPTPDSIDIQRCSACHYVDGKSPGPEFPNIAGQHELYLMKALKMFKGRPPGKRGDGIDHRPAPRAGTVILANYYAKQKPADSPPKAVPDQSLVARGQQL